MVLGDSFPSSLREAATEQRLVPGAVLYLEVTFPEDSNTKEKYLVIVATVEPDVLALVINTEVHPFVASKPELARCQLVIDKAGHPFLSYDSFLACHKTLSLPHAQVVGDLVSDMSRYRGEISEQMRTQICGVMMTQPKQISKSIRDAIVAGLSASGCADDGTDSVG